MHCGTCVVKRGLLRRELRRSLANYMSTARIALLLLVVAISACGGSATPVSRVVNVWSGAVIDITKLPLGDKFINRTAAARGALYACPTMPGPRPPPVGANAAGPWLDLANGTWDLSKKLSVRGAITWPAAEYGEQVANGIRTLASNGLPVKTITGSFPIQPSEPAYAYDKNPNAIAAAALRYELPIAPTMMANPGCLPMGPIGMMRNGVALFAPIDEAGRDAAAWETQDTCAGHPEQRGEYHYHDSSNCLRDAALGVSTVLGWAADGFPIVIERDAAQRLPTNADLDECHGRSSPILLDGQVVTTYHYSATLEFPYVLGCFRAKPNAPR
jgi:YHYH protein